MSEPFDWWAPFQCSNLLDAPTRGQPTMQTLDAQRPPLDEHAEQVRRYVLDVIGREPSAAETQEAIRQAKELRDFIKAEATRPDFFERLEERCYTVGLLSLWWGLSGDVVALRDFLRFMRAWEDEAGNGATAAMTRASRREAAEWHVVAQAIGNMEHQAIALKSPRLTAAARAMRAMLTADRLRPEGPAREARTTGARKAAKARHAKTAELKARILAECEKYQRGAQWKNPAARKVAPIAYDWNREAGKPFSWLNIPAAEKQVRRWLDNAPRSARTA